MAASYSLKTLAFLENARLLFVLSLFFFLGKHFDNLGRSFIFRGDESTGYGALLGSHETFASHHFICANYPAGSHTFLCHQRFGGRALKCTQPCSWKPTASTEKEN